MHTYYKQQYLGEPMGSQDRPVGMLRKNITITPEEAAFLERHPEINQSALFRQVIESMMLAERAPQVASTRDLRLGKAVYRSGAVMFQRAGSRKDEVE
jgi:hypothetical protein